MPSHSSSGPILNGGLGVSGRGGAGGGRGVGTDLTVPNAGECSTIITVTAFSSDSCHRVQDDPSNGRLSRTNFRPVIIFPLPSPSPPPLPPPFLCSLASCFFFMYIPSRLCCVGYELLYARVLPVPDTLMISTYTREGCWSLGTRSPLRKYPVGGKGCRGQGMHSGLSSTLKMGVSVFTLTVKYFPIGDYFIRGCMLGYTLLRMVG